MARYRKRRRGRGKYYSKSRGYRGNRGYKLGRSRRIRSYGSSRGGVRL